MEQAVRGTLPPGHASLVDLFRRHPDWADLLRSVQAGGELSAQELERLHQAAQSEDALLVQELLAHTRQRRIEAVRPRPRPRLLPKIALVAAGLLVSLGALTWWQARDSSDQGGKQMLGASGAEASERLDARLSCRTPSGAGAQFGPFQWDSKHALAPGQAYLVRVFAVQADGTLGALLASGQSRSTSWTMDAQMAKQLPDRIRWSVSLADEGFDAGLGAAWASAER